MVSGVVFMGGKGGKQNERHEYEQYWLTNSQQAKQYTK